MHKPLLFSYNWNNKLYSNYFTTFRPWWYDRFCSQDIIPVKLNFKSDLASDFNVLFLGAQIYKLADVPQMLCFLDAGMSKIEFQKLVKNMYKNSSYYLDTQLFAFIMLERVNHLKINGFKNV